MFNIPETPAPQAQTPATPVATQATQAAQVDISTLTPDTPEYNAAMSARAKQMNAGRPAREATPGPEDEAAPAPVADAAAAPKTKPAGLPDKFWNAETGVADWAGLIESHNYHESGKGKKAAEKPAEGTSPDGTPPAGEAAAEATDFVALGQEFAANNYDLKPETKEKLYAAHGKEVVDQHLSGLRAQVELAQYKVCEAAETTVKEAQTMLQWASTNLTRGQIQLFQRANQGTVEEAAAALIDLKAKYQAATGKPAARQISGGNSAPAADRFSSMEDVKAAMADPRYKTNEAYQQEVARKIHAMRR